MRVNKKILLLAVGLLVLAALAWWLYSQRSDLKKDGANVSENQSAYLEPVFMSTEEKASLYIPTETKVQVLNRDEKGEPITYKIINNDSEVVTGDKMAPIRPENQ